MVIFFLLHIIVHMQLIILSVDGYQRVAKNKFMCDLYVCVCVCVWAFCFIHKEVVKRIKICVNYTFIVIILKKYLLHALNTHYVTFKCCQVYDVLSGNRQNLLGKILCFLFFMESH